MKPPLTRKEDKYLYVFEEITQHYATLTVYYYGTKTRTEIWKRQE